jgi:ankyrin repeat protein
MRREARPGAFLGFCLLTLLGAGPGPSSPVADAAREDDLRLVRALLADGADVNVPQGDGMTALHWAAYNGNRELAQALLGAGAQVARETRNGSYTPLHLAAQAGSGPIVRLLVGAGADVTARTEGVGGATALHFAASAGDTAAVVALLDAGAEVNSVDLAWGQTPLMFAASRNRVDAVRTLLTHGADVGARSRFLDVPARAASDQVENRVRDARVLGGTRSAAGAQAPAVPDRVLPGTDWHRTAAASNVVEDPDRPVEEVEPLSYADLVQGHGGLTALLHAVREGHDETALALLEGGADIDQPSAGDGTSPMLMAMINGRFDLGMLLWERGADPTAANDAGTTPLYAALNTHWAPKSRFPQQQAYRIQRHTYMDVMRRLLEAGVDPDVRLTKHLWYMSFNFDLLQVDTQGSTPFWRAAYALDVDAMKLLVAHGADPGIPTSKAPERRRGGTAEDPSGLPPVPVGGPAVFPLHAASGVGYGEGFAANAHRHVPDGWLPAVRYLVEELGAGVNVRDHNGYAPLHHAAARGDDELILYLVEHGADVTLVSRAGQTTADMANGPYQRTQPYPETVALLERLGSKNNHRCLSC